ncbi:SPFH domain, Band 7 family protein [Desulfobulbus propionicus DSM 2032]|jgi:regulator of protease activity HflC (stomatin/prohibitin superfamily)|uniref:SPFH domain, Band 7 family protein n=1 Tax=Desulfobulbus propionicus (strain ATCC 33891 / DSM 2032 / VKM B-1956 / 1pr3) TaxID=577650 RepID=A0A7U3YPU1_DESPD|nr:SPFH domain-containing protein [Desulfobulbus propionicus]ADW19338.1 SPFH domain, Band 7 family protein [Desulfobulbus propionicus DSM 2032]
MDNVLIGVVALVVFAIVILVKTAVVVDQQYEYVIERLGKYRTTLEAGFHILIPFFDKVAYKRSLKEESIDIPAQTCITADNVSMEIDGCLYLQVVNSRLSAYGIDNYHFAVAQLAQTSLRSAIGKISLDNTFEARENLNRQVVEALDEASQNWGVKVLRYEIKDIQPPRSVLEAMEKQMKAEREKRAEIAKSEGERQAMINRAEGERAEAIARSEGEKMRRINEAEGQAQEILKVAAATAEGIRQVAEALSEPGGQDAANLEVAKKYLDQFGKLAKENNTMILPANLADVSSMVATVMTTLEHTKKREKAV